MLFKNPTVLYGLLFLLVPIIVHLFQLRKFRKVAFSNVAFLKPLLTQTRKSRTLKKWLTLFARLLAVACVVITFAQPFFPSITDSPADDSLIVYLDNSYSMQAKGIDGVLYQNAVNQLIEKLPSDLNLSVFTNDQVYKNVSRQEIANELLNATYAPTALSNEQILLKAQSLLGTQDQKATLLWISDFQRSGEQPFQGNGDQLKTELVKLEAVQNQNISIDSAYITVNDASERFVDVFITANYQIDAPVTVSLYNDNILLAKTTASLTNQNGSAQFKIPANTVLNSYLEIVDEGLKFDNQLFLSTNKREKIKVLHVNDSGNDFLKNIYTSDEFDYQNTTFSQLNYNSIKDQDVVVVNEVNTLPSNFAVELNKFMSAGKTLVVIPSLSGQGYSALNGAGNPQSLPVEKRIVSINFDHPLLRDVFSKRVTNFQYPKVENIAFAKASLNKILSFEDGSSFLWQDGNTFFFAAPLNEGNSNFQNSPLVVPIFYKLGLRNRESGNLYQQLGKNNQVTLPIKLEQDQIVELALGEQRLIPEQRAYDSYVELQTGTEVSQPGTYQVLLKNEPIASLSFNVTREENKNDFYNVEELGANTLSSVSEFVQQYKERAQASDLWKFFLTGALFFLICELMILKFIK
ncbi:BatA domain-containing protein [Nonlabens marinus]|uniref:Aerotolerance regulator N-terminal domain-containing protein n=1 Tax=Nonlabens marinus S1-08 TaxID=1454201 RepID=W8VRW3_9FLAO|nr:BatA domain-containing protein [Nonlabens marinus]BAO56514.1 hypothetical protein NMS_2505 [Nonlabens marinus S1-08]